MRSIVEDLLRIDGVIGALLVDKDGLVVSSTPLEEEDAEVLGAMAAAMHATLAKACERIGIGRPANLTVEANEGIIQLMQASDLLLVVITERRADSDYVKTKMSGASERIRAAMPLLFVPLLVVNRGAISHVQRPIC